MLYGIVKAYMVSLTSQEIQHNVLYKGLIFLLLTNTLFKLDRLYAAVGNDSVIELAKNIQRPSLRTDKEGIICKTDSMTTINIFISNVPTSAC